MSPTLYFILEVFGIEQTVNCFMLLRRPFINKYWLDIEIVWTIECTSHNGWPLQMLEKYFRKPKM